MVRAHPHSRGENRVIKPGGYLLAGSSPLTRGKIPARRGDRLKRGLIPTHAGKTSALALKRYLPEAHPHSRGENARQDKGRGTHGGSSPLTRGKLMPARSARRSIGLIPTHAGKTRYQAKASPAIAAHPHSRGENDLFLVSKEDTPGSSPLTRGKLLVAVVERGLQGLIPTHAGKTRYSQVRDRAYPAHPHSRGENASSFPPLLRDGGSSPLTRGKQ